MPSTSTNPDLDPDKVEVQVQIFASGTTPEPAVSVDLKQLQDAIASGTLAALLADAVSRIQVEVVAVLPNGTLAALDALDHARHITRPALRGDAVTAAVQAVIAQTRPCGGCPECWTSPCDRHIAEAIVNACRQEHLMILPMTDAIPILAAAVQLELQASPANVVGGGR